MKIKTERSVFLDAFSFAASAALKRDIRGAVFQCVRMKAKGGAVEFEATDGELAVRVQLSQGVEVETPGETMLPPKYVSKILSETNDDKLELESNETKLTIRGDTSRFNLSTVVAKDFPAFETFGDGPAQTVETNFLTTSISRTSFACDSDSAHYALSGINFEISGSTYLAVSTDGRRLCVCTATGNEVDGELKAIVPLKAANALARAIRLSGENSVEFRVVGKSAALFRVGRFFVQTTLVEGCFPNWKAIVPTKEGKRRVDFLAGSLARVVRQASIVAESAVEIVVAPDAITVAAVGESVGDSSARFPVSYVGEPTTLRFDPRYLLEFLSRIEQDANVSFYFEPNRPALFETQDGFSYTVMPLNA